MIGTHVVIRIAAPTRGDDVQPAIAIQITGREAVPPTHDAAEAGKIGGSEMPVIVEKDTDLSPFEGDEQIGIAIAVDVDKQRRGNHAQVMKQPAVRLVEHQASILVVVHTRRWRDRISARIYPRAHEEIELPVAVIIPERQRPDAGRVSADQRRYRAGAR